MVATLCLGKFWVMSSGVVKVRLMMLTIRKISEHEVFTNFWVLSDFERIWRHLRHFLSIWKVHFGKSKFPTNSDNFAFLLNWYLFSFCFSEQSGVKLRLCCWCCFETMSGEMYIYLCISDAFISVSTSLPRGNHGWRFTARIQVQRPRSTTAIDTCCMSWMQWESQ